MEQIFVSSVQKELQAERYAVRDFVHSNDLLRQFFHVFLFEDLPPADRRADGVYLEEVSRRPIYVGCVFLDLLLAMGYGGWREEAPRMTKTTNDEAIDGVINEDRLGLDVICVQAKRWQNTVGRKGIQSFVCLTPMAQAPRLTP
jgi:hypothetical protein